MKRALLSVPVPGMPQRPGKRGWKVGVLLCLLVIYAAGLFYMTRPGKIMVPPIVQRISIRILPWRMVIPNVPLPAPVLESLPVVRIPPPHLPDGRTVQRNRH
ncbi:hypothetical protein [Acetobacter sp.]|uniref:hypothetical protein n=1 Tax=Acetobacter sp. TaxID=440 RepID=UPI0025C61831|nr:hypothetical protein [Acetobacter sp.]MCH4092403.1 hypothetical protein [Acetobacter sp.]MCI1299536.1 hypothetical protein [Acetobacter sp.]MCI1315584.1 hypothetical protein [Acetobacter sp.]